MLKKKLLFLVAIVFIVAALLGGGFSLGFRFGQETPKTVVVKGITNLEEGKPADIDFGTFWQAWQILNDQYLRNASVTPNDKLHGAIKGLVGSLQDPYSEFFNPDDGKKFEEDVQGNFGGIGAELGMKKNQLVVIAPLKDTPASRVGLLPNDQILKIGSSTTDGITIEKAVNLIRGPQGTDVILTIFRDGWDKTKDFKITRANIVIPTIDTETVDDHITHLSLHSFNGNAENLFYQAMFKELNNGSRGLILDLRNDPGGFLQVAVNLAGWFLPKGSLVVSEAGKINPPQDFKVVGNATLVNFPVVILINGGSASASEILAGALRDDRHIKLIGETSFGKGTVQQLESLRDGSSIKVTIAHWVLPSGQILENGGLKPDVEVKITDEDRNKKKDPQLDKAIEILKTEIANNKK